MRLTQKLLPHLLVMLVLGLTSNFSVQAASSKSSWEQSIISLEATGKRYDFAQPWSKQTGKVEKTALISGHREILTTADGLNDLTLVRVRKGGRGQWYNADLSWIDYHANLALIQCNDEEFWSGLKPASLATAINSKIRDNVQVIRWRNGKIEPRRSEFVEYTVKEGKLTFVPYAQLTFSSEIEGLGWSEALVSGNEVLGLSTSAARGSFTVTPAPLIKSILQARAKGTYRGLGYFDFTWQPAENTSILKHLSLAGKPRGVTVVDVPQKKGKTSPIKRLDVILQIEGFDIDIQGDYTDPQYGPLMLENLSSRGKWAGDTVRIKIWRDGSEQDISYELPLADYSTEGVPKEEFDRAPQYFIVGGLLFQPLSEPYLRRWGPDWRQRAPFRLNFYSNEPKSPERDQIIVMSMVLPDPVNIGYQEFRYLVLDTVNDVKIRRLSEIPEALKRAKGSYHVFDFREGNSPKRIVLDAVETEESLKRILQRYGIPKDREFSDIMSRATSLSSVQK